MFSSLATAHRKPPPLSLLLAGQTGARGAEFAFNQAAERRWFAVFTVPQNEKSVVRHLGLREIESFLPAYESVRVWKNRQRVRTILPLFPTYLFVHISSRERVRVLESPGVLQIIGNGRESIPVADADIETLRASVTARLVEPYRDLVIGEKVRVKSGVLQGVQGTLVRRSGGDRFVLSFETINQHAAIQVSAEDLEPVREGTPLSFSRSAP
jgi:transcription antitermination factor NusG